MGRVLAQTVMLFDERERPVSFVPGSVVPEWAAARITNPAAWEDDGTPEPEPELEPEPEYGEWTVAKLRAEIVNRNTGRANENRIDQTGAKADLVAALETDDSE